MIRRSKFGNKKIVTKDGKFDSIAEFRRWEELKILAMVGKIGMLTRQVPYKLSINNVPICKYIVDFEYAIGQNVYVEDVKGYFTAVSKLKTKMFRACHPEITLRILDKKVAPHLFRSSKKRR